MIDDNCHHAISCLFLLFLFMPETRENGISLRVSLKAQLIIHLIPRPLLLIECQQALLIFKLLQG